MDRTKLEGVRMVKDGQLTSDELTGQKEDNARHESIASRQPSSISDELPFNALGCMKAQFNDLP